MLSENPFFQKKISRRDFLGIAGLTVLSLAFRPRYFETPTPETWHLSLPEQLEILANPKTFTELQGKNTRKIITNQLDDNEYLEKEVPNHNNTCGSAVVTTIIKLCEYLNTGVVPDNTIGSTYKILKKSTFNNQWGLVPILDQGGFIDNNGIGDAIKLLNPDLVSKTEYFTSLPPVIISESQWPDILSKAQTICESGGIITIGTILHGSTHIIIATNVKKDGSATIIDSFDGTATIIGPYKSNFPQEKTLKEYIQPLWINRNDNKEYVGGLWAVIGISRKQNTI
ncbi:MAG: hypothetical protein WC784_02725 [Candidatus Shapirobacteria bacterium]|jgi:hypothetical protein